MPQTCSHCNAPIALGSVGSVAKCAYCGTDTRIDGEATPGIIVINDPALRARLNKEMADRAAEDQAKAEEEQRFATRASLVLVFIIFFVIVCSISLQRR